ncbi:PH domain-containing protein [Nocardia sp. NPDC003963]
MIRTTRLSFLGVFLLAMCVFFPIVGWPAGLFWLAIIPLIAVVWIVRTQTTVSPQGLDLRSVFSSRHIDWARVQGLSIPKRGFVRVHLDDDTEVPLPAVSYDRLRDLVDASDGRIPDPFAIPEPDTSTDADSDSPAAEGAEQTGADTDDAAAEGTGNTAVRDTDDTAAADSPAPRGDSAGATPSPKTADTEPGPASERE